MAISLKSLESPRKRPLFFTIVAEGGRGKTSLGALFPNPVFIRTEDGTRSIECREDVALFPLSKTSADVIEAINVLINETHPFKTLVLDTVTQLNVMLECEVVESDPKAKSINTALGGYGAGHGAVAQAHKTIRDKCAELADKKGMHIVFLAHADIDTIDLPDQEQFMRYSIRMNKKSVSHYSDNVDVVAFIKQSVYTRGAVDEKTKKATTDGKFLITCYPTPAHIAKNRLGIKTDLEYIEGTNPFLPYF